MKAVLISTQSKWVEKIANRKKTIEVRKTAPKQVPFKCYIYCTSAKPYLYKEANPPFELFLDSELYKGKGYDDRLFSSKVIGEFICDKVDKIIPLQHTYYNYIGLPIANVIEYGIWNDDLAQMCLKKKEIDNYGKGKMLYGWHISDLKIYDRPKELSEFKKTKDKIAMTCGMQARNGLCRAIDHEELCNNIKCCFKTPRPSQSWCYVEELKNEP